MSFGSILFPDHGAVIADSAPEFFHDLHLDQVVAAITAGYEDYDLVPFFQSPLRDLEIITYRQEIMRELDATTAGAALRAFSDHMRAMRAQRTLADKSGYKHEKARRFLDAVGAYCDAVEDLSRDLREQPPVARGLCALRDYIQVYAGSESFTRLAAETRKLSADLSAIRYCLLIDGGKVTVRPYGGEADSSAAVEEAFRKFRHGETKDYRARLTDALAMNHIEARVLTGVAQLNQATFDELDRYCSEHESYLDNTLSNLAREVQFYLAYLKYMATFRRAGLSFCYPAVTGQDKAICARDAYDPALAFMLVRQKTTVVCNDFALHPPERILVVSGPNQGGKTTFARMVGVLHFLASLGCPVPGSEAQLFLFDQIHTHFEREEDIRSLHGKLEDDLVRIHRILRRATSKDLLIINEIFASTSLKDATWLGKAIMARISGLDALCVCVTFLEELTSYNEKTVSLVGGVDPANPMTRTFRLERRPADGLAYAQAIAEHYRVTYACLKERIGS
jgi:DNA mismatch repair protein MutS